MKNLFITLLIFITLYCISCGPTLPLVIEEDWNKPLLTLSVADPPNTIDTKGIGIQIDYSWNSSRQAFEDQQNALEGIKYSRTNGMFGGGVHEYGWPTVYDHLSDSGSFKIFVQNKFNGGYATGDGRLMYQIICSYEDKEGKKHRGTISNYLEIPVKFVR